MASSVNKLSKFVHMMKSCLNSNPDTSPFLFLTRFFLCFQLDTASVSLSREYLIKGMDEKIVAEYYRYMVDIAVLFGAERSRAERELKESLGFEISLANVNITIDYFIMFI